MAANTRLIPGYVYFVLCRDKDAVKIGFTNNLQARLRHMQTGNPSELELLAAIPGSMVQEKALHRKLAIYRLKGEWFRHEGAVLEWTEVAMSFSSQWAKRAMDIWAERAITYDCTNGRDLSDASLVDDNSVRSRGRVPSQNSEVLVPETVAAGLAVARRSLPDRPERSGEGQERDAVRDLPRYLTIPRFAREFGYNEQTVRRWCREGHVHAVQSPGGRGWRIPRSEIERIQQGGQFSLDLPAIRYSG